MQYKFPVIGKFSDIAHAIDPNYFMVADRGDHKIVNYLFASPEVFPDIDHNDPQNIAAIRREFRGLIFCNETDRLIRRPFQKFFNVGERSDTHLSNINVDTPHLILDKLDGSMIVPFMTVSGLKWGTKMGVTDVATQIYPFLQKNPQYIKFAEFWIKANYSPIFEWCSRQQRIVLDYPEDRLILTAIRNMSTGLYVPYDMMKEFSKWENIDCVSALDNSLILNESLVNNIKTEKDVEGFVVRFSDGHMTKIKADLYVTLHRIKEDISHERGIIQLILNDALDDLKPILMEKDLEIVTKYEEEFIAALMLSTNEIKNIIKDIQTKNMTKKEYALTVAKDLEKSKRGWMNSIVFKEFENPVEFLNILARTKEFLLKICNRNSTFSEHRPNVSIFDNVTEYNKITVEE
jgi:T4 RnlA family RNA ligase